MTIDEVVSFVEKARAEGQHHEQVMKLFIRVLLLLLASVLLNGIAMFVVVDLAKDFKPADDGTGELKTKDGDAIKVGCHMPAQARAAPHPGRFHTRTH